MAKIALNADDFLGIVPFWYPLDPTGIGMFGVAFYLPLLPLLQGHDGKYHQNRQTNIQSDVVDALSEGCR